MIPDSNLSFYQNIDLDVFRHYAKIIGLDSGADIEIIYPYIADSQVIVELGSGYGRAIHWIHQKGFRGKIIAIERVPEFVKYLSEHFPNSIDILQQDIREFELPQKVNAILWLWSGILEQSPEEQEFSVKKCYDFLEKDGKLIIETPYQNLHRFGEKKADKKVKFETEWGVLDAYFTEIEDVKHFAQKAGFSFSYQIYTTATNLERIIYLLVK